MKDITIISKDTKSIASKALKYLLSAQLQPSDIHMLPAHYPSPGDTGLKPEHLNSSSVCLILEDDPDDTLIDLIK